MADPSQCNYDDMMKCVQAHNEVRDSIVGALAGLTLNQKQKLLTVVQNWVLKQQPLGTNVTP